MSKIIIPANYTPALNLYDTQRAIGTVKRLFADTLCARWSRVKDIAGLVGYSNISHFSDAFRKKFGCTPSEYKRSLPF